MSNHWSKDVVAAVQGILPEGTVFVLAVGIPEPPLADGSRPVDFQVLTNTKQDYAQLVMRTLGSEAALTPQPADFSVGVTEKGRFVVEEMERTGCTFKEAVEKANRLAAEGKL